MDFEFNPFMNWFQTECLQYNCFLYSDSFSPKYYFMLKVKTAFIKAPLELHILVQLDVCIERRKGTISDSV